MNLWCDELGLSVNPDKTRLAIFTIKMKFSGFFEPRLFGTTLHRSMFLKYLGASLVSQLTWKEPVDDKMGKAANSMWVCRKACGETFVLTPKVVHWFYVPIIKLSVTFASLVWWPGCQTSSAKRKLSGNQRLACLEISGAMHTTPTNTVEALISLPHWS